MIDRRSALLGLGAALCAPSLARATGVGRERLQLPFDIFALPSGAQPERLWLDPGGETVWFTARGLGAIGKLDLESGETELIALGAGAKPRGLAADGEGRLFALDGGLNTIHQLDMATGDVRRHDLRSTAGFVQLMHAALDRDGRIWFTGYRGLFGRLDPASGDIRVFETANGRGPHGLVAGPDGRLWITSVASDTLIAVTPETGRAETRSLPRHLSAPKGIVVGAGGAIWITCVRGGAVARFDTRSRLWTTLRLASEEIRPYGIAIDAAERIWVADETHAVLTRIDPATGANADFPLPMTRPTIRHLATKGDELWCAASGGDKIVRITVG